MSSKRRTISTDQCRPTRPQLPKNLGKRKSPRRRRSGGRSPGECNANWAREAMAAAVATFAKTEGGRRATRPS